MFLGNTELCGNEDGEVFIVVVMLGMWHGFCSWKLVANFMDFWALITLWGLWQNRIWTLLSSSLSLLLLREGAIDQRGIDRSKNDSQEESYSIKFWGWTLANPVLSSKYHCKIMFSLSWNRGPHTDCKCSQPHLERETSHVLQAPVLSLARARRGGGALSQDQQAALHIAFSSTCWLPPAPNCKTSFQGRDMVLPPLMTGEELCQASGADKCLGWTVPRSCLNVCM